MEPFLPGLDARIKRQRSSRVSGLHKDYSISQSMNARRGFQSAWKYFSAPLRVSTLLNPAAATSFSTSSVVPRQQTIVVLGTGWGSFSLLQTPELRKLRKEGKAKVVVVSPRNHFLFTPLLASTTVGTLEFRSIIQPIRPTKCFDEFHLGEVTDIDPASKKVILRDAFEGKVSSSLAYDHLVIGVGAIPDDRGIAGVKEHCTYLKELNDARYVRQKIVQNFELANEVVDDPEERKRLLTFAVVGGGPTGVEFCGELHDFLAQDLLHQYPHMKDDVRVFLISPTKALSQFSETLSKWATARLSSKKYLTFVQDTVKSVSSTELVLNDSHQKVRYGLCVWSTGVGKRPIIQHLAEKRGFVLTPDGNRLAVDTSLRCAKKDSVYAIGDCAGVLPDDLLTAMTSTHHPDASAALPVRPVRLLPATAQVAEREGKYLGTRLAATITDPSTEEKPFTFRSAGMLAYIGGYEGVSDSVFGRFNMHGWSAWFLWRLAYLTRLGSWKLRMQVPIDWTKALIFGRDVSRF